MDSSTGFHVHSVLFYIHTYFIFQKHNTIEVKTITTTNNLSPKAKADYELVLRAIDGEEKAYTLLMTRYRNSIFHMMLKMINNRDDADDLTLEAFGKAFRKLPSYAPRYAFSTWLFKIAINNCIDHILSLIHI